MKNRLVTVGDMYGENPGPKHALYWICLFIYPNGNIIELHVDESDGWVSTSEDEYDTAFNDDWMTYV